MPSPTSLFSTHVCVIEYASSVVRPDDSKASVQAEICRRDQLRGTAHFVPQCNFLVGNIPQPQFTVQRSAQEITIVLKPPPPPQPFYGPFRDHLVEPVPEENFWTLWCKGRLTEALTNHLAGATPSEPTSAHLHHPPIFYRPDAFPAAQPTVSKH